MRQRRRPHIPQRRRIFVGCEGESERGYAARLARILDGEGADIHFDTVVLNGGDPLSIIDAAIRQASQRGRLREAYAHRVVLLDSDRCEGKSSLREKVVTLAVGAGIRLIWQEPCHEAFLLRHLEGCQTLLPPSTKLAEAKLREFWPEYEKAMSASRLAKQLDRSAFERAAKVERGLCDFLIDIGFIHR